MDTPSPAVVPRDARAALLRGLIDDAALFPPAREPMRQAVAGYVEHRRGPHRLLQGRFLCPASRLQELAATLPTDAGGDAWAVGAILDGPHTAGAWEAGVEADLVAVAQLPDWSDGRAWVDAVEVRLPADDADAVGRWTGHLAGSAQAAGVGRPLTPYVELPLSARWAEAVPALIEGLAATRVAAAQAGGMAEPPGAKLRCGDTDRAAFPSAAQVAAFLRAVVAHGVPFKATAGLHHPLPGEHDGLPMHGFLNVLGGAVLLTATAMDPGHLPDLLAETDPVELRLDADGLGWRDHRADAAAVAEARLRIAAGFGSCSFVEPVAGLLQLGILPLVEAA